MHLLDTFSPPDQATWLAQIQKELRELPLQDAGMLLADGIVAKPFLHPSEQQQSSLPLWAEPIDWAICQEIEGSAPTANTQIEQALQGGVTSLRLVLHDAALLPELLKDVYLQMVHLRIAGAAASDPTIFEILGSILSSKGLSGSAVSIFLENDFGNWPDVQQKLAWLDLALQYPTVYAIEVKAASRQSQVGTLNSLMQQTKELLQMVMECRSLSGWNHSAVHFSMEIGKNYFAEIAKIRAWYLLWYNVQQQQSLVLRQPFIQIDFDASVYTDDIYTNMIRATTLAMSAVLGGCTSLTVLPFDAGRANTHEHGNEFGMRIARNVQHLLKLESGMHTLADPASGSYYIEDLTKQFADKVWQQNWV